MVGVEMGFATGITGWKGVGVAVNLLLPPIRRSDTGMGVFTAAFVEKSEQPGIRSSVTIIKTSFNLRISIILPQFTRQIFLEH